MADLLFELDEPQRREREFRLHDMTLDNFTDEELRCRYRFGRESIEFLSDLLANDLQRPTRRNHALAPVVQLLVALRFYASGSWAKGCRDQIAELPPSHIPLPTHYIYTQNCGVFDSLGQHTRQLPRQHTRHATPNRPYHKSLRHLNYQTRPDLTYLA